MDMGLIAGAISSMKAAGDAIQGILALKVEQDVRAKILSIQTEMLNVQSAMMALQNENMRLIENNNQLIRKLSEINTWKKIESSFNLEQHSTGVAVFRSNGKFRGPSTYACPKCFNEKKLYFLLIDSRRNGGETYICPECKTRYNLSRHNDPSAAEIGRMLNNPL